MVDSEGAYRTLCSLETLRSGTKGFFREFSENVARVAGEQWISKVFGRSGSDEDRIRTMFSDGKIKEVVLETLNRTEILYRGKDAGVSRARRLEGFEAMAAGERRKALLLFEERGPIDGGLGLPLAFLARAEVLLACGEHGLALQDLTFVQEMDVPNALRMKVTRMKEACDKFLRTNEKSLVPAKQPPEGIVAKNKPLPPLTGGKNPRLPAASALLEIEETETAGKRAIATKRIEPGDRLVVEVPIAAMLLPEFFGTHCHHCFSRFKAPVGCPDCSSVAFCGRKCRDSAMASYHKYECKILALLIGSGMTVLSMLALRMTTQRGLPDCLKIVRALNDRDTTRSPLVTNSTTESRAKASSSSNSSRSAKRRSRKKKLRESRRESTVGNEATAERQEDRKVDGQDGKKDKEEPAEDLDLRAYDLVAHEKRRTAKDFFERSLMAAFLLKCLQRVGFFDQPTKDEETPNQQEIAVGSLLLKHLQLLQFNAHEVFETRLGADHRFRGTRPVYLGVAIYPTVARFNHDCYPAVTRYFHGRCIVIRAIRSLRPGDVVAENYGPIFTKRNLEERRTTLAGRYWFCCECAACRENWPLFQRLTNDHVRLRCPTEGCPKLHQRPSDPSKRVECSSCSRKLDLRGSLEAVQQCEELYARGFAAMEQEQPETALEAFFEGARKFHRIAVPPHKDTHLAEIAASACMADEGNVVHRSDASLL